MKFKSNIELRIKISVLKEMVKYIFLYFLKAYYHSQIKISTKVK